MKTLVVFSHTFFETSRVNRALLEEARSVPGVTVRNLEELYGSDPAKIDIALEQKFLAEADRVIFQCPIFWFSVPAMLKSYIDRVWTHGWAYGSQGHALEGKVMQFALTAGAPEAAYQAAPVAQLFLPMQVSAGYVGMKWQEPCVTYGTLGMNDEAIAAARAAYRKLLEG